MLKKYAQEISNFTADAIGYPVFITDMNGIIIGCSDPNRGLGTLHEASLRAIETKCGYLEDEEDVKKFRGTNKGATYPIEDSTGVVVGTVAITGEPEKVAPFALVVKKQVEILLREKLLSEVVLNQERSLQNLIQDIANFDVNNDNESIITDKAKYFGYDNKLPYIVIIVELSRLKPFTQKDLLAMNSQNEEIIIQSMKTEAFYHIRSIFSKPQDICSPVGNNQYVILKALFGNTIQEDETLRELISFQCGQISDTLLKDGWKVNIGIGSIAYGITGLSKSCREGWQAVLIGKNLHPREEIYYINDYRVEEILLTANRQRISEHIVTYLNALKEQPDWEELRDTITTWCESQFNMAQAAGKLHIHRNTLDYRLSKIERISSIDPRRFRQILKLYIAIQIDLITNTAS